MLLPMTMAEPSPGATTAALDRHRLGVVVWIVVCCCALGWALWAPLVRAQPAGVDPSQPYLRPPPGHAAPIHPPPSTGLLPDSEAPAPDTDRKGTDAREETMIEPGDGPDRLPPVSASQSRSTPAPLPRPSASAQRDAEGFKPPPRPQPAREPSGRSATVLPPFAVRVDPLAMLVEGKLGVELELRLAKGLTLEFVPLFQVNSTPVAWDLLAFNFRNGALRRESNGIGPLAGAAIGLGIWFSGKPFKGVVLRAQLTNVGFEYMSMLDDVVLDSAVFTERRLSLTFGRVYRLGPIVFEASAGLRYELNGAERCNLIRQSGAVRASDSDCDGSFLIATTTGGGGAPTELFSGMGPFALTGRLSLGFAID